MTANWHLYWQSRRGIKQVSAKLPQVERVYQNHHLDSTRWDRYSPRDDDVIIATPYKSGTTWMQMIVLNLLHGGREGDSLSSEISPWVDMRLAPLDDVMSGLEAQRSRRFVKTHLPLDGLPYFPKAKYIVVGRDARDVFMSLWNHYQNFTPDVYERFNDSASLVGAALPYCPSDVPQFWHWWITRGLFEWESEGYPFWANMRHVQSWWNYRHLPNILFVHFNDLLSDLEGEVLRVAGYLDTDVPDDTLPSIVNAVTFKTMKSNAERFLPDFQRSFRGGAQAFIYKGTNGRWKEVLTAGDLELYEAAAARELTPECALWLEHGRTAVPGE